MGIAVVISKGAYVSRQPVAARPISHLYHLLHHTLCYMLRSILLTLWQPFFAAFQYMWPFALDRDTYYTIRHDHADIYFWGDLCSDRNRIFHQIACRVNCSVLDMPLPIAVIICVIYCVCISTGACRDAVSRCGTALRYLSRWMVCLFTYSFTFILHF